MKYKFLHSNLITFLLISLILIIPTSCKPIIQNTEKAKFVRPKIIRNQNNIRIGVEYAMPGLANAYSNLGIPAVKHFPEEFEWGKMQPSKESRIDFSKMDKYVKEYQKEGFTDIVISLKTPNKWASKDIWLNFTPKPQCYDLFDTWVKDVVERYDNDKSNDMPGLEYPINLIEIGVEFSSYEPEPADDYIEMLEHAYKAAHSASSSVKILHSAFLVGNAFVDYPDADGYEKAFSNVDKRIMFHSLADIRKILDRPDIFDMANFHALNYPSEIEEATKWLKYEMKHRNYSKPIVISDTCVAPFIAYGRADITIGNKSQLPIIAPPAIEADRLRLKSYFRDLISGNKSTIQWVHTYCAQDMVKKILIAAHQDIYLINAAFMEEFEPAKWKIFGAAAGNASWSAMTLTAVKPFSDERIIKEIRPSFYAIRQLVSHIYGYDSIERINTSDNRIRLYKITKNIKIFYIAWFEPDYLVLASDKKPTQKYKFIGLPENVIIENMISDEGELNPNKTPKSTSNGVLEVDLTESPKYLY